MGILNITNDSFSGDGILDEEIEKAVSLAKIFAENGVDIIDVGGESTRPGSMQVEEDEEIRRVIPVIKAIRKELDIPISIDTYKSGVAKRALEAGATLINDVWGLKMDEQMAKIAAKYGCTVILMHNRSKPLNVSMQEKLGGRFVDVDYDDLIPDIKNELRVSIDIALKGGIKAQNIILDVGIGFGKTVQQNLKLVNNLHEFKSMGYPILFGPSRKSFIGYTLNLPPEERLEGTAASIVIGIMKGANIIRVHDVKEMVRIARMTDAIIKI